MRTHRAGDVRAEMVGEAVTVCGWVAARRDHGGVVFVDLRDTEGVRRALGDRRRLHRGARPLAEADHRDDGPHADDDAEHRQARAQRIAPEHAERQLDGDEQKVHTGFVSFIWFVWLIRLFLRILPLSSPSGLPGNGISRRGGVSCLHAI